MSIENYSILGGKSTSCVGVPNYIDSSSSNIGGCQLSSTKPKFLERFNTFNAKTSK